MQLWLAALPLKTPAFLSQVLYLIVVFFFILVGGQGSKVSDASRNVTAQTPAAQENDTESSLLSKVTDYEKKGSLLTMDYGDICPSYDLPIELSGWMGDFGEIGNGSEKQHQSMRNHRCNLHGRLKLLHLPQSNCHLPLI